MSKSLYAQYFEERRGGKVLETEFGFVAYRILEKEVFLDEVFVKPEFRKGNVATHMLDEIAKEAKEKGVGHMTCAISPAANGSSEAMKAALAYGFKLHSTGAHEVYLAKEI